jgi:hypothetical protein|tara:strand:- start:8204 stop:8500 length:297 start_codon:yes stop_codon:yes gene_type:complete
MSQYKKNSPYGTTRLVNDYLDIMSVPNLAYSDADEYYTIETKYEKRPDLLAYSLYGDTRLWWVFIKRNMDVMEDPIADFKAGLVIRLPSRSSVSQFAN